MAKQYINESQLRNIIAKQVKAYLTEGIFGNDNLNFEAKKEERKKQNKIDGRLSDINNETKKQQEKRDSVEEFFENPSVNDAAYAYKLDNVTPQKGKDTKEMKNARHKFANCLHHEKNDAGYTYSFTSAEINHLANLISNQSKLNERINKAVNESVKKLNEENLGWSNDVWDEFNYLEEVIGPEKLLREIAGKLDEYTLKSILKTIKGHYNLNDDME